MWIKRVIGVAGDEIVIKGREITINGKRLERENVPAESLSDIRNHVEGEVQYESNGNRRYKVLFAEEPNDSSEAEEFSVTVPPRSVFVMGDNRDRSRDSRHIGSIHAGDVIGHIDYIYYPTETWSRFGVIED